MHQALVGDFGLGKVEVIQVGQPREVDQPLVGDLAVVKAKHLQVSQFLEVDQTGIGDLSVVEVDLHYFTVVILLDLGTHFF